MGQASSFSTLGGNNKDNVLITVDSKVATNRPKQFRLSEQQESQELHIPFDHARYDEIMQQSLQDSIDDQHTINHIHDTGNLVLFIGQNSNGESGLGHLKSLKQFTELPSWIQNIYSGNAYTIYTGNNNKILCAAGTNHHGACGVNNLKSNVIKQTQITYFEENDINITKICVTPTGSTTFWITDDYKIYGNGLNDKYQLGLSTKSKKSSPVLIRALCSNLWRVINIESALNYSIALVSFDETGIMIIDHWFRSQILNTEFSVFPLDIKNIIISFTENNRIFSTEHGHGTVDDEFMNRFDSNHNKWSLLKDFQDENIIDICTGYMHSLFLDYLGNVWSCGSNLRGQLGSKENDGAFPKKIEYFIENEIKIEKIKCGAFHNLALDINGRVYSWGFNYDGQCGDGTENNVRRPKLIKDLVKYEIVDIQCGYHHCCCKTKDGEYFMFGKNGHNECMTFDEQIYISKAYCINDIIESKFERMGIKDISLGSQNTKIILYDKNQR